MPHDEPSVAEGPLADVFEDATRRQFLARAGGTVLATSAVGSLLAACGGDATSSGSGEEVGGTLSMLIWEGYDSPKASAPFRKQNDVTVRPQLINSNSELITKLLAGGAGSLSLVTPGNGLVPLMVDADVLEPLDLSRIPNTGKYDPRFTQMLQNDLTIDGEAYAVPFTWGINTLLYNAAYISTAPASFMDLTKPEFTNKIGMWDDVGNIQTWASVLGYDALDMTQAELDKVIDFLIDLKTSQARVFTSDFNVMTKSLAGGDVVAYASPMWTFFATLANEQGGNDVRWTVPSAGGILWVDTWAIPKGGPNQATAYAWIDYMIGQRANKILTEELSEAPVNAAAIEQVKSGGSGSAEGTTDLYGPEVEEKAELFAFPVGGGGSVGYDQWVEGWKRVQAA